VIILCDAIHIGKYRRRIILRNPLQLFLVLAFVCYVEFFLRSMEASLKYERDDPREIPPFVDIISQEEENFMKGITYVKRNYHTNEVCLERECLELIVNQLARPFPKANSKQWCVTKPPVGMKETDYYGMLMVKVPKAASSTAAAATLRIQTEVQNRTLQKCRVEYNHRLAREYAGVLSEHTFLWSTIRDPAKRALSRIFFTDVSFKRKKPTDEFIIERLGVPHPKFGSISAGQGGFQVRYTSLQNIPEYTASKESNETYVARPERVILSLQRIIDSYGFLALVERMDESLVVLSMLLNLPLTDVLISSNSKVAGNSYFMRFGKCVKLVKAFVSPDVQKYLDSNLWKSRNYGDTLLHMIVNRSLDLTIDQTLGRRAFLRKFEEYKRLKALDLELCAPKVILPCSKDGKNQVGASRKNCYAEDYGCGYPCIDSMLEDEKLHSKSQQAIWKPVYGWFQ